MRRGPFLVALLAALAAVILPAKAQEPLVADLSKHLVAITTGFAGTDVLLFGAVDEPGDVVVVVRGPARAEIVRRKERAGGIWVNTGSATVENAPMFYGLAATRPLDEIASPAVLDRHQIGFRHLDLRIVSEDQVSKSDYRDALIRLKKRRSLYSDVVLPINFLGQRLFRTEMHFPSNVPVGTYSVEVYLFKNGEVVSAQTTPLIISKIGVGAEVFDFAHQQGPIYGIIAIILAVSAGWLAATAFRKG
ncbi:MAG: TIGR02186 family protein [Rhodospirillales bacterium]|nr:TIGR02186 family protein [Rhodospirillales bacterium]